MARKLALLLLLLCSAGWAQELPVEVELRPAPPQLLPQPPRPKTGLLPCPACDCRGDGCFQANCGCAGPVTQEVTDEMLRYIEKILAQAFGGQLALKEPVRTKPVSPDTLTKMAGGELFGLYDNGVLYVSNRLTRPEAFGVLAHEYGHAWHYQHHPNPDGMSGPFSEGFAEWVAYQVLTIYGNYTRASLIRRNFDPEYGEGFRWYLSLEKEYGVGTLLDVALKWRDCEGRPAVETP